LAGGIARRCIDSARNGGYIVVYPTQKSWSSLANV
jgi:hypothetical protein